MLPFLRPGRPIMRHAYLVPANCLYQLLTATLLLISIDCSTSKIEAQALPFRVAVAPLAVREITSEVDRPGRLVNYRLEFSGDQVASAIAEELDAFAFSEVVTLGLPEGVEKAEFAAWLPAVQSEYLLAEAKASGVDLILTGEVLFSPFVRYVGARGSEYLLTGALAGYVLVGIPVAALFGAPAAALLAPVVSLKAAR